MSEITKAREGNRLDCEPGRLFLSFSLGAREPVSVALGVSHAQFPWQLLALWVIVTGCAH